MNHQHLFMCLETMGLSETGVYQRPTSKILARFSEMSSPDLRAEPQGQLHSQSVLCDHIQLMQRGRIHDLRQYQTTGSTAAASQCEQQVSWSTTVYTLATQAHMPFDKSA